MKISYKRRRHLSPSLFDLNHFVWERYYTYVLFYVDVNMLAREIPDANCIIVTSTHAIRRNLTILCQADWSSGCGLSTKAKRRVPKEKNNRARHIVQYYMALALSLRGMCGSSENFFFFLSNSSNNGSREFRDGEKD